MKKWRSLIFGVASAAFLGLSPANVSAGSCNPCESWCDPCCWDFCDMHFTVGAEFLWWKPCVDDLDVAALLTTNGTRRRVDYESLCPEWEPGFRVYLEFPNACCNWDLSASFTYLSSDDHAKQRFRGADDDNGIISPLIFGGAPFDDEPTYEHGKQRWKFKYNEWDVLLSYEICCNSCHHFRPYFGVAGLILDQDLKAHFSHRTDNVDTHIDWDSEYWGVGLRAGSNYQFDIGCGFSVFAKAHATLLAGEADSENKHHFVSNSTAIGIADERIHFKDDDCCHFIPGYNISAGFSYTGCWCDWEIGARLGYEFVWWQNLPNHRIFFGDNTSIEASHSSSPDTRSIGFHGLVAGLSLSF